MDDGDRDFSENGIFSNSSFKVDLADSLLVDNFFDEILRNTHSCTHTHACNLPGPDNMHTHTCFHTHTQFFTAAATAEENVNEKFESYIESASPSSQKKRPIGNREAVKKYRQKKKAHTAYLEEQVAQLRGLNQQLLKRVQGQAAIEAEVIRLRALLSELRGRIEGELGMNYYQKTKSGSVVGDSKRGDGPLRPAPVGCIGNSVNKFCDTDISFLHPSSRTQEDPLIQKGAAEASRSFGICDVATEI